MAASTLDDDQLFHFARQLILSGFEDEHQIKLAETRVLLIGAGGLGAPLLQYLVAAGLGHIAIVDDDDVEATNLNRQVIHPENHIGMAKVKSAEIAAKAMNQSVTITPHHAQFSEDNCTALCQDIDLIVDASDNPATRLLANDTAHALKIPLVFAGPFGLKGKSQVSVRALIKRPIVTAVFSPRPQAMTLLMIWPQGAAKPGFWAPSLVLLAASWRWKSSNKP